MQGHRSSLTTLPENISFDHGSSSSDAVLESQIPWNNIQTETNIQYLHHVSHEGLNVEWSLGETSSGLGQREENGRKREHLWNMQSGASLNLEEPSSILSLDNVNVNADNNHIASGLQISGSNVLPQDLNMHSGYGYNHEDDDCQVVEPPSQHIPSNNERQDRASSHLDCRRVSCKRKAIEANVGQSTSGAGGSFDHSERSQWHAVPGPPAQIAPTTTENGPASPFSLTTRGPSESVRRNPRLRINGAHHQDHIPFSPNPSGSVPNRLLDLNPVENGNPNGQSMPLNVPSMRRNHQSRWNRGSSSRTNNSSDSATLYEEPLTRNIPRSISEHPMFVPASETGGSSSLQNINLVGGSNSVAGNIGSSSRAGPNSPSPNWANRACPQYPRRLSEIVRRSLLSSAGSEVAGQSNNHGVRSQEMAGQARSNSRAALLERHLDAAIPIPYSLRTLAAAGEGRSNIMSEIRHVMDLMRRGEGLRLEDVMMLDHSVLFGMADIHDRHRNMRLDVDNMSYEELLALGDRIGNVCTGLTEETIMSRLKLKKYVVNKTEDQVEIEPCSICREEYNDGEDVGTLECGHDFHKECIKQWLLHKNLCPICKTTGLTM